MITFTFCNIAPIFASLGKILGTLETVSSVIELYDEELDKEAEFHLLSQRRTSNPDYHIRSRGEWEDEPQREALYRQVYHLWQRKLGILPPLCSSTLGRSSFIYSQIWDDFDNINYERLCAREPSLSGWRPVRRPNSPRMAKDISLEGLLMRHPFSIYHTKVLSGRRVALFNNSFQTGYCIVPEEAQPGDMLCSLRDPLQPLLVLRPVPEFRTPALDRVIKKDWEINPQPVWLSPIGSNDETKIRHFTLIGEGWVQKTQVDITYLERAHFRDKLIVLH